MEAQLPVILLLDDQAAEVSSLSRLLADRGYQVLAETNPQAASEYLQRGVRIDILLAATQLHENGAGFRVLEACKRHRPATPIVAITPGNDVAAAVKAMRMGASDCVTQPVDPQSLFASLSRLATPSESQHSLGQTAVEREPGLRLEGLTIAELERLAIMQTLQKCDGNRTMAARQLGISVRTLQRKLRKWSRGERPLATSRGLVNFGEVGDVPPPLSSAPYSSVY
jgi:DNA-binding NtrC family response regulator